jgi:hypothetical protein
MDSLELIEVECYAGYKAEETPRAFIYRDKRYEILEIIDRWYEGGVKTGSQKLDYYKVKADDGRQYMIRYNSLFDKWALLSRSE